MRLLDLPASVLGLLLLSPLLLLIALLIKLDSPGPVFHRARRVGKGGELFKLYKYRTMVENAASLGPGITGAEDTRITRAGRYLRRYKLDELPQLINVIRGEMSLVGPRPEDPRYVAHYTSEQRALLALRPGITSPASLAYRDEATMLAGMDWEQDYLERILPDKLAIELEYQQHRTVWSDVRLIWRTMRLVMGEP